MQSSLSSLHTPRAKPKLLVVDDEPDNLDLLYRTFYREFQVLRAENGAIALSILETQPDVAIILSDQRMPGMSGTLFLSETAVRYPNAVRIILTGYSDVDDLVQAINEGKVFKYVTKPWEETYLRSVVAQALETHRILKARTEELERSLRQESLLNAITHTIRSAMDSQQMMQTIIEAIGTLMEADISILRPQGPIALAGADTMVTIFTDAVAADQLQQWKSHLAWEVSEVTPLTRATLPQEPNWQTIRAAYDKLNIQSTVLVPLVAQQQLIAVLALHHCETARLWQGSDLQLLATTAEQAALALFQAVTYEQVQALARREQLLNAVTQAIRSSLESEEIFAAIAHELGQALQVDSCVFSLWTAAAPQMRSVGIYQSLAIPDLCPPEPVPGHRSLPHSRLPVAENTVLRQLLETQAPIAIHDLSQDPQLALPDSSLTMATRSLMVVPLMIEGEIIGSISLRYVRQPHAWTSDEVTLAQAVAAQAAIAVQQARLYQKTREQAQQLLALDRQKTTFFQNISHEFRTPLTLMLGMLESNLKEGESLQPSQVAITLRNARRLLRLVNQLLDLQRLDAGRLQPTFRPVKLESFVDEIATAFRPYCDRKHLHLTTQLVPCPPVYLDPEKFDKVLYNLLSNAVKFTPSGGHITVTLRQEHHQCYLTVQDTGIGIRADQLPHLFERFQQADGSTNRRYEGTGLGLALVKELVALHYGQISVESVVDVGTTFQVTLPVGRDHLPQPAIIEDTAHAELSRASVELADVELAEPTGSAVSVDPAADTDLHTVLVVEDNRDLQTYIAQVLQTQGYRVQTAAQGSAALALMQETCPDLILTDLMMPGMSGMELIKSVRQDARYQRIPIVLLTAKVDDETRIEGVEQGADAYLVKPFYERELLAEVRNLLALKANERQVAELNQYLTKSVLQRFLPPSLVDQAAAGELQLDLEPELRLITVLFSDIVGYTTLSNQLGPHRIARLLNEYLEAMTNAIFDSRGTVDKFMGDGVMALFGAPEDIPPEEQARQAIAAVQRMHQALVILNRQWQARGIEPIQVRYGIHQGDAVVGLFGSAVRADYTAIGPCVNIAARLQEVADADSALVSAELAHYFPLESIAAPRSVLLRGLPGPLLAHSIRLP